MFMKNTYRLAFVLGICGTSIGCNGTGMCLPNNFMCPPTHQCQTTAMSSAPVPPTENFFEGEPIVSSILADPALESVPVPAFVEDNSQFLDRIDELEEENNVLREQLSSIDSKSEEARKTNEKLKEQLETVVTKVTSMEDQLTERRVELDLISGRLQSQDEQNQRILTDVEKQLDQALSEYAQ